MPQHCSGLLNLILLDTGNVADIISVYMLLMENDDKAKKNVAAALRQAHKEMQELTKWKCLKVEKRRVDNLRDGGEKHAHISRNTLQDNKRRKREKS